MAAMAMAQLNGCNAEELRYGIKTYHGVDRRFDFKIKTPHLVFLSDYAHHPNEILQSAQSLRQLYKDRKITAVFQPHLYTRTRDFYKEFAKALSLLDEVILCDVLELAQKRDFDVLVFLGAGDLDSLAPQVTKIVESKAK